MRMLTPSQLSDAKRQRAARSIRPSFARTEEALSIRLAYPRPWDRLTAEERCNMLGQIASELRAIADQADEERLAIAQEELTA